MENFLFKAYHAADNNLTERWVTQKEAERLKKIYEAAGWKVTIKDCSKEEGQ